MFLYYLIIRIISAVICRKMAIVRHRNSNWAIAIALILGWPAIIWYLLLKDKENPGKKNDFSFESPKRNLSESAVSLCDGAAELLQQKTEYFARQLESITAGLVGELDGGKEEYEVQMQREAEQREAEQRETERESKLIPGINKLKDLGFVKYNSSQNLTPIVANSNDWIEKITPFYFKNRKVSIWKRDEIECYMGGVSLNFNISIYKEGVLANFGRKGTYLLPFDASVQFNIIQTLKRIRRTWSDDTEFMTIDTNPLDRKLYYSIERHLGALDTNHYTKSGKVDKRYSSQNNGIRTTWQVEQSVWELSNYRYSISSSKGWEICLNQTLDLNFVYHCCPVKVPDDYYKV